MDHGVPARVRPRNSIPQLPCSAARRMRTAERRYIVYYGERASVKKEDVRVAHGDGDALREDDARVGRRLWRCAPLRASPREGVMAPLLHGTRSGLICHGLAGAEVVDVQVARLVLLITVIRERNWHARVARKSDTSACAGEGERVATQVGRVDVAQVEGFLDAGSSAAPTSRSSRTSTRASAARPGRPDAKRKGAPGAVGLATRSA